MSHVSLRHVAAAAVLSAAVLAPGAAEAAVSPTAARHFANCTALNKVYPHGVGKPGAVDHVSGHSKRVTNFYRSRALYNANSGMDRDHDGIACERL